MTDLQKRFVEEYTIDCNAAAAAVRAGYTGPHVRQTAYELRQNEEVSAAIKERLNQLAMPADEALKHISDLASTRLNEFMTIRTVLKTPMVRKGLQQLIDELDEEMALEDEFAKVAGLKGDELTAHKNQQKALERKGIRYALELGRNPHAYRDVPGEAVYVEEAVPDLVALAKAKDRGRIKALSFNEHGPKVELYAADAALNKVLEYHGKIKGEGNTANVVIFQIPDNGR